MKSKATRIAVYVFLGLLLIAYLVNPLLLDPVFRPLLKLPLWASVLLLSTIITVLMTLIYKWMTDQTLLKSLKEEQKKFQSQMKENKNNPKKLMDIQRKAMDSNMTFMKESFRPTLITFIPLIIIFAWMSANFSYSPILPGQQFNITALPTMGYGDISLAVPQGLKLQSDASQHIAEQVTWTVLAEQKGIYVPVLSMNNKTYNFTVTVDERQVSVPQKKFDKTLSVAVSNGKARVFGDFNLFGWYPGWLATYIISSLILSIALRKVMGIY